MKVIGVTHEIIRHNAAEIDRLLWENLQAYFEISGAPGTPPLSSLGGRCRQVIRGDVCSFSIDGVEILRVSVGVFGVRVLYSLLTGGELGEADS